MNRYFSSAALGTALLLCAGCAQNVTVMASGTSHTADPIPQRVTYTVLPTTEVAKDQAFPDYAQLVSEKMEGRGYKRTSEKTAQLGVFLAYGSTAGTTASVDSPPRTVGAGGGMGSSGTGSGSYGMGTTTTAGSPNMPQYRNQLVIVVVEMQKSAAAGSAVELWRGDTTNTGSSNDLKKLAPLMVDAAFQHFGETTSGAVSHRFDDETIRRISGSK